MNNSREALVFAEGLEPLLTGLKSRWVRDFLLTSAPIHLNQILSPSLPANSIQIQSNESTMVPTKLPVGGDSSMHIATNSFFTPSFSSERNTYGVGVVRGQVSNTGGFVRSGSDGRPFLMNFRFAISPSGQSLTSISDLPLDDVLIIGITQLKSFTDVRQFCYFVKKTALRRQSSRQEGALTASQISSCLLLGQVDQQKTLCFKCGAHWSVPCDCNMSFDRPLHPFDFSYFMRNVQPFLRSCEPVQKTVFFALGRTQMWKCEGSRTIIKCVKDVPVMNDLAAWCISEYLSGVKGIQTLPLCEASNDEKELREADGGPEQGCSVGETASQSDNNSRQQISDHIHASKFAMGDVIDDIVQEAQRDDVVPGVVESTAEGTLLELSEGIIDNDRVLSLPETEPGDHLDCQLPSFSTNEATSYQWEREIKQNESNSEKHKQMPCKKLPHLRAQADLVSKAQQRQESNREAARRSNERRKQERDALQYELGRERENLQALRRRENELRKKNLMLRNQVKKAGIDFVYNEGPDLT